MGLRHSPVTPANPSKAKGRTASANTRAGGRAAGRKPLRKGYDRVPAANPAYIPRHRPQTAIGQPKRAKQRLGI